MLVVVFVLMGLGLVFWMFVHALRSDDRPKRHGWIAVVPLMIVVGWLLEQFIMG